MAKFVNVMGQANEMAINLDLVTRIEKKNNDRTKQPILRFNYVGGVPNSIDIFFDSESERDATYLRIIQ